MSLYYLMAQLPSLDGMSEAAPMPISEEYFLELCGRFLGKKTVKALSELTLLPEKDGEKTGNSLTDKWYDEERLLRLALSEIRAEKMKKAFEKQQKDYSHSLLQAVTAASEADDPLIAEQILNKYRLDFLESLRPIDNFCENSVFYYSLKLKLLSRIKNFDRVKGREQYQNIYSSIMSGEEQRN